MLHHDAVALPLSARDLDLFTPESAKKLPKPPVYRIRIPTVRGKAAWQRTLDGLGAKYWSNEEMRETLRDGVNADFIHDDQRPAILATLDRGEELRLEIERLATERGPVKATAVPIDPPIDDTSSPAEIDAAIAATEAVVAAAVAEILDDPLVKARAERAALAKEIAEIERVVARYYPRFREMAADRGFWSHMAPLTAGLQFTVGWENAVSRPDKDGNTVPVKFRKGGDGLVDPAAYEALPENHQILIGWRAFALMNLGAQAAGN